MEWTYIDPDYRREPNPRPEYPVCECCFRKVDPLKAVRVETNWDLPLGEAPEMSARPSASGKRYVGQDCWTRLSLADHNPNENAIAAVP